MIHETLPGLYDDLLTISIRLDFVTKSPKVIEDSEWLERVVKIQTDVINFTKDVRKKMMEERKCY